MTGEIIGSLTGSLLVAGTIAYATKVVAGKIDRIGVGIDRLGSQFTEGFSLLLTRMDLQNNSLNSIKDELDQIHQTLKSPLLTQAAEQRNLGLQRMSGALWHEAVKSFYRALELDETDAVSHLMLGKIFLDGVSEEGCLFDAEKASQAFLSAARYAAAIKQRAPSLSEVQIEALYLRSSALFALAADKRNNGADNAKVLESINEAIKTVKQLLTIDGSHLQGRYLLAKLYVVAGDEENADRVFADLVKTDPNFLGVAIQDQDFGPGSPVGHAVFNKRGPWVKNEIERGLAELNSLVSFCNSVGLAIPADVSNWMEDNKTLLDAAATDLINMRMSVFVDPPGPFLIMLAGAVKLLSSVKTEFETTILPNVIDALKNVSQQASLVLPQKKFLREEEIAFLNWPSEELSRLAQYPNLPQKIERFDEGQKKAYLDRIKEIEVQTKARESDLGLTQKKLDSAVLHHAKFPGRDLSSVLALVLLIFLAVWGLTLSLESASPNGFTSFACVWPSSYLVWAGLFWLQYGKWSKWSPPPVMSDFRIESLRDTAAQAELLDSCHKLFQQFSSGWRFRKALRIFLALTVPIIVIPSILLFSALKVRASLNAGLNAEWADASTGLTWQVHPAANTMILQEATSYCKSLSAGGHSDWRLPTISELRSLIRGCAGTVTGGACGVTDECLNSSCRNDPCTGCGNRAGPGSGGAYWPSEISGEISRYWSSSAVADAGYVAWFVNFDGGQFVRYGGFDNNGYARCVRP